MDWGIARSNGGLGGWGSGSGSGGSEGADHASSLITGADHTSSRSGALLSHEVSMSLASCECSRSRFSRSDLASERLPAK
eukprot:373371-Prymnesium_polylepis.1